MTMNQLSVQFIEHTWVALVHILLLEALIQFGPHLFPQ